MAMRRFAKQRRTLHGLMMLAMEANHVIGLRLMKLMLGGKRGRREAELMVTEKIDEALKAGASLMAGASGDAIVRRYRRRVARNAKRLSGPARNRGRRRRK